MAISPKYDKITYVTSIKLFLCTANMFAANSRTRPGPREGPRQGARKTNGK
jgi:hypothetical protein